MLYWCVQDVKMGMKLYCPAVKQAKIKPNQDQTSLFNVALNSDNVIEYEPATTNVMQQVFYKQVTSQITMVLKIAYLMTV